MPDKVSYDESLLLVDDDPQIVQVLRAQLTSYKNVYFALSGEQAVEIARARRPDLILLDENMPGMSGLETCRAMKADPRTQAIPVIFVTGTGGDQKEAEALDCGAVDFLLKPVSAVQVNARVRVHLRLQKALSTQQQLAERLRDALNAGKLGAWEWSVTESIMTWHDSMESVRQRPARKIKTLADHLKGIGPDDATQLSERIDECIANSEHATVDFEYSLSNGDLRQLRVQITPMIDEDNPETVNSLVGLEQDVSDWHRSQTLLESANRQLEQFAALASHDLRAPVRQMSMFADIAKRRILNGEPEQASQLLEEITQAGERLQSQTQSYMDLAQHRLTEPGEWKTADISELVSNVFKDLASEAAQANTELKVLPMGSAYVPVNLVSHIWRNLAINAIRHQKSDNPAVIAGKLEKDGKTYFFVEDRGQTPFSLKPGDRNNPELDSQGNPKRIGLGVEICQRVVSVLGGKLSFDADCNTGNRVLFALANPENRE